MDGECQALESSVSELKEKNKALNLRLKASESRAHQLYEEKEAAKLRAQVTEEYQKRRMDEANKLNADLLFENKLLKRENLKLLATLELERNLSSSLRASAVSDDSKSAVNEKERELLDLQYRYNEELYSEVLRLREEVARQRKEIMEGKILTARLRVEKAEEVAKLLNKTKEETSEKDKEMRRFLLKSLLIVRKHYFHLKERASSEPKPDALDARLLRNRERREELEKRNTDLLGELDELRARERESKEKIKRLEYENKKLARSLEELEDVYKQLLVAQSDIPTGDLPDLASEQSERHPRQKKKRNE